MQFRVACHSTDLIEEEREIVENKIKNRKIDIVLQLQPYLLELTTRLVQRFRILKRRDYDKK